MRHSKLFTAARAAILLGAVALVPVAHAADDAVVKVAGGVSYVSGGVGLTSIDRLNSMSGDFNLKLVFAMKSGDYVSGVNVTIANAAGATLVSATSEGPWFMTKLPAGNYQVMATFSGNTEKRAVTVGSEKLRTVDFRFASE